nr:hypothetical protein [Vibrio coralliilyticus]
MPVVDNGFDGTVKPSRPSKGMPKGRSSDKRAGPAATAHVGAADLRYAGR